MAQFNFFTVPRCIGYKMQINRTSPGNFSLQLIRAQDRLHQLTLRDQEGCVQISKLPSAGSMKKARTFSMAWFFIFFFLSGFCSILYELVWLRLSMAQFGVTTAMVSIVLSVFMAGLGFGSWGGGVWIRRHAEKIHFPALRLYAATELLIGASGFLVPAELQLGHNLYQHLGSTSSVEYYLLSGIWVALTIIPWCALMGATIPVAMLAIGRTFKDAPKKTSRSFSFLYMANVGGAVMGTALPLLLIELLGFHKALRVGVACNIAIAIMATLMSRSSYETEMANTSPSAEPQAATANIGTSPLLLLFAAGLTSMGMEVVWIRQFTPYLGTVVYAFAGILATYLSATFIGSGIYRRWSARDDRESPLLWTMLALAALFPLFTANPAARLWSGMRIVIGIAPLTGLVGFLTPMLVDRWAKGDPARAGKAYAVNVVGCILGPLVAGFLFLPWISERWALLLLAVPWFVVAVPSAFLSGSQAGFVARATAFLLVPLAALIVLPSKDYEGLYRNKGMVLRDSTATVIATGTGMDRKLLVNGYGMTSLTPITKMMAHLPLAFLDRRPENALAICFGMGTTFRSLHSWGIPITVVELVPSVPKLFGFYHSDAAEILNSPLSHVVIDDGRRYLERTSQQYDVITIDPPPPVEAAGSSLLYSRDLYYVLRQRLRPGGILQQWLPGGGDREEVAAVALALRQSFPHVRVFGSVEGWGYHFLASDLPIPDRDAAGLAKRLPAPAVADLLEWGPNATAAKQFEVVLDNEMSIDQLIAASPSTPALSDDRPINEYYKVRSAVRKIRRWRERRRQRQQYQ